MSEMKVMKCIFIQISVTGQWRSAFVSRCGQSLHVECVWWYLVMALIMLQHPCLAEPPVPLAKLG